MLQPMIAVDSSLGRIPRRSFFIFDFPFVSSVIMSSHEQDLSDTTFLCRCSSLGRFTEW